MVDLGLAAKFRPCVVIKIDISDQDRALARRNRRADPVNSMTKSAFPPRKLNTPEDVSREAISGPRIFIAITVTNAFIAGMLIYVLHRR